MEVEEEAAAAVPSHGRLVERGAQMGGVLGDDVKGVCDGLPEAGEKAVSRRSGGRPVGGQEERNGEAHDVGRLQIRGCPCARLLSIWSEKDGWAPLARQPLPGLFLTFALTESQVGFECAQFGDVTGIAVGKLGDEREAVVEWAGNREDHGRDVLCD